MHVFLMYDYTFLLIYVTNLYDEILLRHIIKNLYKEASQFSTGVLMLSWQRIIITVDDLSKAKQSHWIQSLQRD